MFTDFCSHFLYLTVVGPLRVFRALRVRVVVVAAATAAAIVDDEFKEVVDEMDDDDGEYDGGNTEFEV